MSAGTRAEAERQVQELDQLFAAIYPLIREYHLENGRPDDFPVVNYQPSIHLKSVIDVSLGHEGQSLESIVEHVTQTLRYSARTGHPRFYDKLFAGTDPVGQLAEFVLSVLNTNVHTFAVSPVFSVIEKEVIRAMADRVGYAPETADGIFVPGDTYLLA